MKQPIRLLGLGVLLIGLTLLLFAIYGLTGEISTTKAEITNIKANSSGQITIEYKYRVAGNEYFGKGTKELSQNTDLRVGDQTGVFYFEKSPFVSNTTMPQKRWGIIWGIVAAGIGIALVIRSARKSTKDPKNLDQDKEQD